MALKEIEYGGDIFEISYELENIKAHNPLIFLHGWGSNKDIMKQAFSPYFKEHKKIYIDMPGFGKSPNSHILATSDYVALIEELLKALDIEKFAIFGHSFGGKVGTLLNPKQLILLSTAGIPIKKSPKVKTKIALSKMLKPLFGEKIKKVFMTNDAKDMPLNMYETLKNVVDENFEEHFKAFQNKTLIFWGKEDRTTPLECGQKIESIMQNSTLYPLEGDHYFFLKNGQKIEEIFLKECS